MEAQAYWDSLDPMFDWTAQEKAQHELGISGSQRFAPYGMRWSISPGNSRLINNKNLQQDTREGFN
jgi:hypothetical protein